MQEKFYVHVIGCQQNEHDGIRIKFLFDKLGFSPSEIKDADIIIVVACSVRQTAVDRVFGLIKNYPKAKIIVTGCVLNSDKRKFGLKNVDFWDIENPKQLAEILKLKEQNVANLLEKGNVLSSSVPIMFGCNNFCTYCATAFTRGRERSRKMFDVIKDVELLISSGKNNILLLGQTIDSYRDPETGSRLDILFQKLNDLEGEFEVSFMSNHPKDMSDEIIDAVARLKKIKKEIHLPLQSGSDKILKAMNRPYTKKQYLKLIDKIRKAAEINKTDIKITTDIIVGFPGETEGDFQETVETIKDVGYLLAYINKYSPRPGTAAFKLGDPISWSEKQRRWRILNEIVNIKK